jgi:hypothetical protein
MSTNSGSTIITIVNTGISGKMRHIYRYTSLSGVAIAATLFMAACTTDGKVTIDCTVQNPQTRVNETVKVVTTADRQGTACDEERAKVKAAQALPTTAPTTNPLVAVPESTGKKPEIFKSAFVPGKDSGSSELIPVVDPQKRQEELISRLSGKENNRDPFSAIPGTIRIPNFSEPKRQVLRRPTRKNAPSAVRIEAIPVVEPPKTEEASSVFVSGVIEVNGTTYAIISAPNEPTTRYVSAGTRLSNNQVLVKRIDKTGIPTVILEQNGVEVSRPVGKAAVIAAAPGAAAPATTSPATAPGTSQLAPVPQPTSVTQQGSQEQSQRLVAPGNVPTPGLQIINNSPIQ